MTFELNYEVWLSRRRACQVREKHKLRYPSGIKHDESTSEVACLTYLASLSVLEENVKQSEIRLGRNLKDREIEVW